MSHFTIQGRTKKEAFRRLALQPPVLGLAEVAEVLQCSRQHVADLKHRAKTPPVMAQLSSGPIWSNKVIEDWLKVMD